MALQDVIVLLLVILLIIGALLPFSLRKRYPDKLWLGIVLCIWNLGTAHFYLPGGLKYFLGLFVLFMVSEQVVGSGYSWLASVLISVGIMYWRFLKKAEKPWQEKV